MAKKRTQGTIVKDEYPKQCAWIDKTSLMRCGQTGHLSQTVYGEGPWYCRSHFAQVMGWDLWVVDERQNPIYPQAVAKT